MVNVFRVTVDFLLRQSESASFDKDTVDRINDIQKLDNGTKNILFNVIDTYFKILKRNRLLPNNNKKL